MTYPFRVPLVCILPRLRDSVTDQMLSPGDTFWASADRAAEVIAIGAATLLDDSDAVIEAVAAFADDPAIVRLYEHRAAQRSLRRGGVRCGRTRSAKSVLQLYISRTFVVSVRDARNARS